MSDRETTDNLRDRVVGKRKKIEMMKARDRERERENKKRRIKYNRLYVKHMLQDYTKER